MTAAAARLDSDHACNQGSHVPERLHRLASRGKLAEPLPAAWLA